MTLRGPALLALVALASACSTESTNGGDGPNGGTPQDSAAAFTVSYRNKVRLPAAGTQLEADAFVKQIKERDPIASTRCSGEESAAYQDITKFLGGISWTHPVSIIKNSALPPLYDSPEGQREYPMASAGASADNAKSAGVTIERPDLVGVKNGIGVFLSELHGLIAVDARGASPVVSCSMKLPGSPKNFLFHGDELVVIVNAQAPQVNYGGPVFGGGASDSARPAGGGSYGNDLGAALLRYSVAGGKLRFIDAVKLEDQTITDARLFDSTIVAYTSWTANKRHAGQKVMVVQWDDALGVDWQDTLVDDPTKQDPLEGQDPTKKYVKGDVVSETKTYASFVTASERYFVVPRNVHRASFRDYATYNYQVCTSYNPKFEQVQSCYVNYEKRANPDYKAPDPVSGNYSCGGKKLADCIQQAAPVVSQWVYVPVSQTCNPVWIGRCEKYESRSTTYPEFDYSEETELTIYRFENGTFTKLDNTLSKLVEKTDAIAFETSPLVLKGAMSSRNQLQFQNGQMYYFGDNALQTLAVAGNSLSYLQRLDIASNTNGQSAIAFSDTRAMISSYAYSGAQPGSQVTMLDLTVPSKPAPLTSFTMPGQSTQLILATGGILGPGTVQVPAGSAFARTLEKLTLFSNADGNELDNLLLGTDYDAFETSYLAGNDDQRIRLSDDGSRVFLPFSGRHHADSTEPTAHRLGIARIENSRLVSERSFSVNDDIIRTAPVGDKRSLVFGNSASYAIDRTSGDWTISTLQEIFVPFATYRLDDKDLYATIARVGTKCRITVHAGDSGVFAPDALGAADVDCNENDYPVAINRALVFAQTKTGIGISDDGKSLTPIDAAGVDALLASRPQNQHCWVEGANGQGTLVEYLDTVPSKVYCKPNN